MQEARTAAKALRTAARPGIARIGGTAKTITCQAIGLLRPSISVRRSWFLDRETSLFALAPPTIRTCSSSRGSSRTLLAGKLSSKPFLVGKQRTEFTYAAASKTTENMVRTWMPWESARRPTGCYHGSGTDAFGKRVQAGVM